MARFRGSAVDGDRLEEADVVDPSLVEHVAERPRSTLIDIVVRLRGEAGIVMRSGEMQYRVTSRSSPKERPPIPDVADHHRCGTRVPVGRHQVEQGRRDPPVC